jgi:ubiquinone/menaquinone biosynthesis C-methylase UbiE
MGSKKFETSILYKNYWSSCNRVSNFVSYYYQTKEVIFTKPKNILEIGVGNKLLSSHLKNGGYNIKTLDINKNFNPDFVGDIRNLPFKDNSFDTICAFEVLEHIPFKDLDKIISELRRVSKKYVVLSLPIKKNIFVITFQILSKKMSFLFKIPFIFNYRCKKCPSHYWEIGLGASLKEIKEKFSSQFYIVKDYRVKMNPYHYFFILKKK